MAAPANRLHESTAMNSAIWRNIRSLRSLDAFKRQSQHRRQTLERGASRSSIDVRHNDQFENRDIGDFNSIFLDLAYCVKLAEIPLLAHNFSKRAPAIWRPSQDELLCTLCFGFFEDERDASEPLRLIKE